MRWRVGVWGNGSTPEGFANIFCDEWEITVAVGLPIELAEQVVEDHNEAIERLRKALEFYADVSKYPAPLTGGMGELWSDCGNVARDALDG